MVRVHLLSLLHSTCSAAGPGESFCHLLDLTSHTSPVTTSHVSNAMQGVNRAIYFAPWAWDLEMFIMRLIVLSPFRCEECRTYLFTNMFVPDTRTRDEE